MLIAATKGPCVKFKCERHGTKCWLTRWRGWRFTPRACKQNPPIMGQTLICGGGHVKSYLCVNEANAICGLCGQYNASKFGQHLLFFLLGPDILK